MGKQEEFVKQLLSNYNINLPTISELVSNQLKNWGLSEKEQSMFMGLFIHKKQPSIVSKETGIPENEIESFSTQTVAKIKKMLPSSLEDVFKN